MVHEMKLKEIYYDKIKNKEKIYEIRLNDEKRKLINIGDIIIFKKEPELEENIKTKVVNLIYFDSFKEMIDVMPLDKVGFGSADKDEIEDMYHKFYTVEDENKYGVLAIKIDVIE